MEVRLETDFADAVTRVLPSFLPVMRFCRLVTFCSNASRWDPAPLIPLGCQLQPLCDEDLIHLAVPEEFKEATRPLAALRRDKSLLIKLIPVRPAAHVQRLRTAAFSMSWGLQLIIHAFDSM